MKDKENNLIFKALCLVIIIAIFYMFINGYSLFVDDKSDSKIDKIEDVIDDDKDNSDKDNDNFINKNPDIDNSKPNNKPVDIVINPSIDIDDSDIIDSDNESNNGGNITIIKPGNVKEPYNFSVKDTYFKEPNLQNINPIDKKVTYTEYQVSTKKQLEYGVTGSNSQWPVQLETSRDGSVMLFGVDVAGMFISKDHGLSWSRANSGIDAPGVGMFAIDPYNNSHILALGLSKRSYIGGIYMSMDMANSWNKTFNTSATGARYHLDGLEFDATTYNKNLGITTDIYYSTPYKRDADLKVDPNVEPKSLSTLEESEVGLYYSCDGGNSFELIINDIHLADGIVKVTDDGTLYVGNYFGLYKIDKVNKIIDSVYLINTSGLYSKGITGLDAVGNTIYAQTWDGIYKLDTNSDTPILITNQSYPNVWPQALEVSQTNTNHMMITYRKQVNNYYTTAIAFTLDGGKTWDYSEVDLASTFYNVSWTAREKMFIIDPSDDSNVITFGSDYVMHSSDYGKNFIQSRGLSHMMQGGKFNFNYYNPDLLFLSAQDYTGVITHDGGKTYTKVSIPNLGNVYGGFAADDNTYYGFAGKNWGEGTLMITHNDGDTWTDTGLRAEGVPKATFYSSLQSPTNSDVLFAAEYYSKDKGYTWQKMNGCVSVFTFNYTGKKELYGADKDANIVVSYDNGDTWTKVSNTHWDDSLYKYGEYIIDLAYDHVNNIFYLVSYTYTSSLGANGADKTRIYKYDANTHQKTLLDVPRDTKVGSMRYKTVAVDPNSTGVIYVGGSGDYFQSATSLMRSIDGGSTWRVLTTANKDYIDAWAVNQGGYEISNIRVNPYTGNVFMSAGCNGYFVIDPPYDSSLLNVNKPSEHTIKYVYNGELVAQGLWKNGIIHDFNLKIKDMEFLGWYMDKDLTIKYEDTYVFNSMILYAKMQPSKKINFYENEKLVMQMDLDKYSLSNDKLILKRDGYVFAGWYSDKTLTNLVDLAKVNDNINVYAGFYKVKDDIYDVNSKDADVYISYTDQSIRSLGTKYNNSKRIDNRTTELSIKKNTTYFVTMKMDSRFRLAFTTKGYFSSYNVVPNYYIHPFDINSKKSVNKNVSYLFDSGDYQKMLIYYYTLNDNTDFMKVKETIHVYELVDKTLYL